MKTRRALPSIPWKQNYSLKEVKDRSWGRPAAASSAGAEGHSDVPASFPARQPASGHKASFSVQLRQVIQIRKGGMFSPPSARDFPFNVNGGRGPPRRIGCQPARRLPVSRSSVGEGRARVAMDRTAIVYLGYGCIAATVALFWFGLPDKPGEPARWLRGAGPIQFLFPVLLMALFAGRVMIVVGVGGTVSKPS